MEAVATASAMKSSLQGRGVKTGAASAILMAHGENVVRR